ncbi:MAG: 1-hydroxycarotenoid 3,4-desaturase CrtD [Pseudomonadota bacterium]
MGAITAAGNPRSARQESEGSAQHRQADAPVVIIGAGMGGLAAAITLAARGVEVLVLERAAVPGGKVRVLESGGRPVDAGPTVFTMPWVFESLFADAGADFHRSLQPEPMERIAHHGWQDGSELDLFSDLEASAEAISSFSSAPADAQRFLRFMAQAERTFSTLKSSFLEASKPNPVSLSWRAGVAATLAIRPFQRLMTTLEGQFEDPRLRQLFGRYATYCGASPYQAPATLMLVAHVEQMGVYRLPGGMVSLAGALADLAVASGAQIECGVDVVDVRRRAGKGFEVITGDERVLVAERVIANADAGAIADGVLGDTCASVVAPVSVADRSLSAITWVMSAEARGRPIDHHNVYFSRDYAAEFHALQRERRMPSDPTVYVCAQDRPFPAEASGPTDERLLCLINAPPTGDLHSLDQRELNRCEENMFRTLENCGVALTPTASSRITTPTGFQALFPGTGGNLYGRASHGWQATFRRPANRTRLPGFYLAGGSVHPGPGVPMAAMSGRLAAQALLADSTSRFQYRPTATAGGISMP